MSLAFSCRPRQPADQVQPGPEDTAVSRNNVEQVSGRVFVTGSEPDISITLVPTQGSGVTLVGSLQRELARLSGATVRVRGAPSGKPASKALDVKSYDLLGVDGEVPRVGAILIEKGAVRLADRDTIDLANPPEELREREGAKVWIVGRPSGEKLIVESYGIIREAGQ